MGLNRKTGQKKDSFGEDPDYNGDDLDEFDEATIEELSKTNKVWKKQERKNG